jgi:hypothetical protein
LASKKVPQIVAELRDTHKKYHASISRLPNPDAVVTGGEQKGLDYLLAWADAFI